MRNFLTVGILSLVLLGAYGVPKAFAEPTSCLYDSDCGTGGKCDTNSGFCTAGSASGTAANLGASCSDANGNLGTMTATGCVANAADPSYVAPTAGSGEKIPTNASEDTSAGYNSVMQWIMMLFAWLLGVAALTLDYAVYYTVITMGHYVSGLSAVGTTWRILRDIGNIALIFGFLAAGIATIVGAELYGWKTKMIPMLLAAAIFLNFSLFFAEAVIDVGNLFATQIYTQINGGEMPTAEMLASTDTAHEVISNKIMSQLGLQGLYGDAKDPKNKDVFKGGNPWIIGFMGILLFITTAFVMFSLAFVLIARFVALIFLIIIAPIGFAGKAIPAMSAKADKWWHQLFMQTFIAPILLLMLYVALAVITDAQFLTGFGGGAPGSAGAWTGFVAGNVTSLASLMLPFLVAMGLLILVTVKAKDWGAAGASFATKTAGKLTFGATALGMSASLGLTGNALASKRMQSWARRGGVGGLALKGAVLAGKGLRSSTYDMRNTAVVGAGLGALGVDAGKGVTLTAKQAHEAQYGAKPVKKWFEESKVERETAGHEMDFKDAQRDYAAGKTTRAQYDAAVTPTLSRMSTKELEEMDGVKNGTPELVENLSPQQYEALMKSDKLSDGQKSKIKEIRYTKLSSAVSSGSVADIKSAIGALSKSELQGVPSDILSKRPFLDNLNDKQRETLTDSGNDKLTAAEKDLVRNSSIVGVVEGVFTAAGGGIAGAAAVTADPNFAKLTPPQIAKLKKEILLEPAVITELAPAALAKLADENKFSATEMQIVGRQIAGNVHARGHAYITGPAGILWQ